jgi:hypothetical protein
MIINGKDMTCLKFKLYFTQFNATVIEWSCVSITPYVFMAKCIVRYYGRIILKQTPKQIGFEDME